MFINFFFDLKQASLPVSLKEYLMLMEAMNKRVVDSFNVNDFYYLSRSALVKDERYLDKFDRVFGHSFKGLENSEGETEKEIPEEWLKLMGQKYLTEARFTPPSGLILKRAPTLTVRATMGTIRPRTALEAIRSNGTKCTTCLTTCTSATNNTLWSEACNVRIAMGM